MNVGHKVIIEGRSATIVSIDGDRIQAPHRSALVQFDDGSFALRAATSLRSDTPATPGRRRSICSISGWPKTLS